MRNLISASLLLLGWLCLSSPAAAQAQGSIDGRWVGEYRTKSKAVYIVLNFEKESEAIKGSIRFPLVDAYMDQPLTTVKVQSANIYFELRQESGVLTFRGQLQGDSITGNMNDSGAKGLFKAIRVARVDVNILEQYEGDYQLSRKSLFVIGRVFSSLYYLVTDSGRTGRLLPSSEKTFWGGASVGVSYPIKLKVTFVKDHEGRVTGLFLHGRGLPKTFAKKVKLYNEEAVSFQNGDAILSGTMRIPLTPGPHPAVVMLHGSNNQPRNGQNSFIGFVADHFARHGLVVLTYDKRGVEKSTGKRDDNYDLLTGDAMAGIQLLQHRSDVNPQQIGLWGISQGGQLAPIIASRAKNIAFIINVSGSVVNSNEQEIQRTELQLRADGFSEEDIRDAVALQKLKFHFACTGLGWEEYEAAVQKAKDKKWFPDPYIGPPMRRDHPAFAFWKCGEEPARYWESYTGPTLAVYGELETYSSTSANLARFTAAMKKAGNTDYTIKIFPHAEHSMTIAKTGGERELPLASRYVPGFFDLLTAWVAPRVKFRS